MAPVILLSFNWDSAAFSVTEPPRGGRPAKEEPFTLYCLLPQRAHISFHTLSICLPFLFYTSLVRLLFLSPSSIPLSIFYKVWRLDNAPLSVLACQRRRERAKCGERHQRAAEMDGCLYPKQQCITSDQRLNSWGWTGSCICAEKTTTTKFYMIKWL